MTEKELLEEINRLKGRIRELEQQLGKKTQESHPKQGTYSSEDVAIEKFFYCGNK